MTGWPSALNNATFYFDHPMHGECWNKTDYKCITPSLLGDHDTKFEGLIGHYAHYPIGDVNNACAGGLHDCDDGVCTGGPPP